MSDTRLWHEIHQFMPTPDPKRPNLCVKCVFPRDHEIHTIWDKIQERIHNEPTR